ncbi:TetR/AcrR family transcriptional regulator [Ktedonospora formicarum]|uniref:TetR family transcriptional regulator n=1 Tax=Ktedonospora formicarum TaxID=2778364 RepID=A0A8J3IA02_9CHLR|nr:TetR/AcrR family transcriptional regulator [Ktedonospora formicarum]GHO51351.1 TetR family transcriptional regulator [Ktedonospora formicarum]
MADVSHSARQRILATATDLFSREGYRAVGTDTIIERAGIAKMTLYRHFSSKNELINAFIEETIQQFWVWFERAISEHPDSPRAQLVAIFETLASIVADPDFHGCSCLQAAVEFPELEHPSHQLALQFKQRVHTRFREIGTQAGAQQPDLLADQLLLLMNGALMQGRMRVASFSAQAVVQAARALIEAQVGDG